MPAPLTINLGCGSRKAPGELGVDRYPGSAADLLADLSRPLPFRDRCAGRVICRHVLEHVPALVPLIEEIHRILVPGGVLAAEVPYFGHPDAFRDPTHCRFFTWGSFDYFIDSARPADYTTVAFRYRSRELEFSPGLEGALGRLAFRLSPRRYEKYHSRSLPARVLRVELEKI